ncbi:MAG: hypothetical protein ACR2PA_08995 [Hyphomicrobiaceae bacterium]
MAKSSRSDRQKWQRLQQGLAMKYQVELAQLGQYEHRLIALLELRDRLIAQFGAEDPSACLFPDSIARKLRTVSAEIDDIRPQRDAQRRVVHRAKSMAERAEEQLAGHTRALSRDASEKQSGERVVQNAAREQ